MSRAAKSFLLGMMSVFSFGRARLYASDTNFWNEIDADIQDINSFPSDADAMRHDFEKVGGDIWKAMENYDLAWK